MSIDMAKPVVEWALDYVRLGWRVVPIRPGGKIPSIREWQKKASDDPQQIEQWWRGRFPDAGVGIATGQGSGVWVLDVDPQHGGAESLRGLVNSHDPLPRTPRVNTPSGGFHLYFRNPPGLHVATTKNIGQLNGHPSGLDVRGDGGQVLAPPTIHPNGNPYLWMANRDPWKAQIATAPDWLLELVVPIDLEPQPLSPSLPIDTDEPSAAREMTEHYDWHELLSADGWTLAGRKGRDTTWTRPNKDPRLGVSAILHEPEGPLVNYSTEATGLCQPWARNAASDCWSYSIFGYIAATRFGGDRSAAARDWRHKATASLQADWAATSEPSRPVAPAITSSDNEDSLDFAHLINWNEFWTKEHVAEDWACYPIIPAGRSVALHAAAKQGKSTIVLAAVAAVATGRPVFGNWVSPHGITDVLYLDYEMTEDDIFERMSELGYGPDVDMTHLHYAMLPSIFPLDTEGGAFQIEQLAIACNAKIVVIDTFSRAVKGEENQADTSRDFYRHTGMRLKARGIAVLRTDHSGKDDERGQRGSSAKNDDVDVVWKLERSDQGVKMTRSHSRVAWVPPTLSITKVETEVGNDYVITTQRAWPAGTRELAQTLKILNLPPAASYRQARSALTASGEKASSELLRAALEYRKIADVADWAADSTDNEGLI